MDSPFFSIIIPTRNRYETLRFAIATVLRQEFDSFELIISDNSDPDSLHEGIQISEQVRDSRIRYIRPETVLPMSDHWEFALSKATGQYIIVFGDDDGLVAGSLEYIHRVIKKTAAPLVSWLRVEYNWPDRQPADLANKTIIPYTAKTGLIGSEKYIKDILDHKEDYRSLPMLYNSAVSNKLIAELKEKTGRVFSALSPDIYTGYAFAHMTKHFISIGRPLSINGVSAKSNGAAHQSDNANATKTDFWELVKKSKIRWPDQLPEIITTYTGIVEPFIQLQRFFPELAGYINRKQIFRNIIKHMNARSEEEFVVLRQKLLDNAGDEQHFQSWVEKELRRAGSKIVKEQEKSISYTDAVGFNGSHLVLDASGFGLKTVEDLSVFIGQLFGKYKDEDFQKPVTMPLTQRIRKAAGMILRPA